ncbi:hypothetical protein NMBM01240355_0920 [Neisseria meningitidis M01-240355]|nr:hypothetical protein NMBM01240355_0920 [Neisseria meningitidis M01-240355]
MCAAIMAYFGGFVRALFDLGVFERGGRRGRREWFSHVWRRCRRGRA